MIPNVFPIFMALGLMGFTGTYMDVGMMTFSAIIIGVAVDATIHFFVRFRREFERLGSYSEALSATLSTVGRPITFTTLTLTLGFAVLALSNMYSLVHFGLLAGFAFSWALLADFFFSPALVVLLRPLGPERASRP
jgi:predicted RND superfamily exporter protein